MSPDPLAVMQVDVPESQFARIFAGDVAESSHVTTRRLRILPLRGASVREKMSPVKSQGRRGTCSVFAAVALLEAYRQTTFSEQCLAALSDKDPGTTFKRLQDAAKYGVNKAQYCPYISDPDDPRSRKRTSSFNQRKGHGTYWNLGNLHTRVFRRPSDGDPVDFIKGGIIQGYPVGVSCLVIGDWWHNGGRTPSCLWRDRPASPPVRDRCSTGPNARPETSAFLPYEPFAGDFRRSLEYYFMNNGLSRVWRDNDEYESIDFAEYLRRAGPLTVPSEADIARGCKKSKIAGKKSCSGHAIVVTGYDDVAQVLEFKNSWGPYWKNDGYGYMSYAFFRRFHLNYDDEDPIVVFEPNRNK